jgi:hypothetical protein
MASGLEEREQQPLSAVAEPRAERVGLSRVLAALERGLAARPERSIEAGDVARRIIELGIVVSVVAVAGQTVLHLADIVAFDRGVNIFDADDDVTVSGWASTAATFAAAVAVLPLAVATGRRWYFVLAGIFAFFSFDDFIRLHERLAARVESLGIDESLQLGRLIWAAVFFPLLALTAALLWAVARTVASEEGRLIRVGLALLAAGVVLEAASPLLFAFDLDHKDWQYETEVVLEEGAELAGWIWISAALLAASCRTLVLRGRRG